MTPWARLARWYRSRPGFVDQQRLDDGLAHIHQQLAQQRAERLAAAEAAEHARVIADRERRAAEMSRRPTVPFTRRGA